MTFLQELDHGEEGRRQSGQSRQGHEEVPGGRGGGRPRQHSQVRGAGDAVEHRRHDTQGGKVGAAAGPSDAGAREASWGTRREGEVESLARGGQPAGGQSWDAAGRHAPAGGVAELGSELDQGRAGKDGSERRSGKRSWQTGPAAAGREASTGCGGGASVGTGAREGGHAGGGAQPAWEGSDMREERIAGRSRRTCGRAEVGTRGWSQPQERRAGASSSAGAGWSQRQAGPAHVRPSRGGHTASRP
ncbi:hypothetical protein D1007_07382 [Hordeum vulgare]|nr:hypothetical protein D1007_07382 [Hordeum vulgare]